MDDQLNLKSNIDQLLSIYEKDNRDDKIIKLLYESLLIVVDQNIPPPKIYQVGESTDIDVIWEELGLYFILDGKELQYFIYKSDSSLYISTRVRIYNSVKELADYIIELYTMMANNSDEEIINIIENSGDFFPDDFSDSESK